MSGRGVWFSLAVEIFLFSSSPVNNKAAGSRFVDSFQRINVSYAGTFLLVPWQGLASAPLAPNSPSFSCWFPFNKLVFGEGCPILEGWRVLPQLLFWSCSLLSLSPGGDDEELVCDAIPANVLEPVLSSCLSGQALLLSKPLMVMVVAVGTRGVFVSSSLLQWSKGWRSMADVRPCSGGPRIFTMGIQI